MRRLCFILEVLAIVLVMAITVSAQSTANLSGIVQDATGAVVIGANVTITNQSSGDQRKTVTNKDGYFSVTTLPVATYKVTIAAKGFARYEAKDITLNANDTKSLNVNLPLASVTETVEVSATTSSVALVDTGEKSAVISYRELQDLSLVSRNAAEYIKLLPGATLPPVAGSGNAGKNISNYTGETIGINGSGMSGNQGGLSAANINGQQVDITMDGGHIFDPGAYGAATPVNPNADMISEVKVLSSNFGAENAKGPVIVNFVSKSGGNQFHGGGYLYSRNAVLNAADSFNQLTGSPKGQQSYWYPGAHIGGPVLFPGTGFNKSRQKLFFFDGFEYYKQTIDGGVMRAFVPTDAMFNGDFSGLANYIVDGRTIVPGNTLGVIPTMQPAPAEGWRWSRPGCTITGGVLSSACIDPGSKTLLRAYVPAPNADPLTNNGYNWKQTFSVPQNAYQNLARVDWSISDNTKVFVRYNRQREIQNQPTGLWGGSGTDNMVPSPSNVIGENGSDSLSGSLTHVFSPTMTNESTFTYTKINFPNKPADPTKLLRADMGYPYKGIFGNAMAPALVTWGGAFPNLGEIGHDYHPTMICYKGLPSFTDNFTKVLRTHTLKLGFYYEHVYNTQDNWGQYMGAINYPGGTYTVGETDYTGVTGNSYADVLMGVGFSGYTEQALPPAGTIAQNIYSVYAQDSWKIHRRLTLEFGMRFEHIAKPYDGVGYGLAIFDDSKYNNDASALPDNTGVLWHKMDSSIPLSGADSRFLFFSPRLGLSWDVFGTGKTVVRGGWGKFRAYDSVQSGYFTGPAGTAIGSVTWGCGFNDLRCPDVASIDANATTAEFGQPLGPQLKSLSVMDPKNDEQPLVTTYSFSINQQLPWKFVTEMSYVGNEGSHLDVGGNLVDINAVPLGTMPENAPGSAADSYRPRRNYQAINMAKNFGKSQFDSMELSLRRTVGLVTLQANYTWGKAMGNGSNQSGVFEDYGLHYFWGVLPQNRAQAFSASYVLNMPTFKGGNKALRGVINGWQISGVTQVQSGVNLIANSQFWGASGSANAINIYGTNGMPGVFPILTCDPRKNLGPHQFINGACFRRPENGELGHGGYPYIAGPKFLNSDLSLMKNFKLSERQNLQFRLQMFNFLNHPLESFSGNDGNLKVSYAPDGSLSNSSTFGYTTTRYGHRIIELALKYSF